MTREAGGTRPSWIGRLLIPALALAVGSCSPADTPSPPVRIETVGATTMADIAAESVSAGLTARDAAGQVIPGLAQSWRVSDDGLLLLFRLRPARFADGTPIVAADVVASLQRARRSSPLLADLLAGVLTVKAPLPEIVEMDLGTPQPELLELLATPALAIRSAKRPPVDAGPFVVSATAPAAAGGTPAGITLRRNPTYHAATAVKPETVQLRAGSSDVVGAFLRGEADLVLGGRLGGFADARVRARRGTFVLEPAPAVLLLLANHRAGPLADVRVRRALALAVDRDSLGPRLFGSPAAAAVPALSPPAGSTSAGGGADWAGEPLAARQAEAQRLLGEAGVALPLRLQVAVTTAPEEETLMAAVAADLGAVGIELSLARRRPPAHAAAVAKGEFALALVSRETSYGSPLPFLLPFRCAANRHGVCLPGADRLLAEAWEAPTAAARLAAYAAAERLWADDVAAIGLVQPLSWALVSPQIDGFSPNPAGAHPVAPLAIVAARRLRP